MPLKTFRKEFHNLAAHLPFEKSVVLPLAPRLHTQRRACIIPAASLLIRLIAFLF